MNETNKRLQKEAREVREAIERLMQSNLNAGSHPSSATMTDLTEARDRVYRVEQGG